MDYSESDLNILPSFEAFTHSLHALSSYKAHPSLAIIDPLVPSDTAVAAPSTLIEYDTQGLSSYARGLVALLSILANDRRLIHKHPSAVTHILALEILGADVLALPSQSSPLFRPASGEDDFDLASAISKAQQTVAYALSSLVRDVSSAWHRDVTALLRKTKTPLVNPSGLGILADTMASLYWGSSQSHLLQSRIFFGFLRGLLREASPEEGDMWLTLAQSQLDSGRSSSASM